MRTGIIFIGLLLASAAVHARSFMIPDDPYLFDQWGTIENQDDTVTFRSVSLSGFSYFGLAVQPQL